MSDICTVEISEQGQASIDAYGRGVRAAVRGFWNGVLDFDQFYDAMISNIEHWLPRIWHDGAAKCGILPNELSPEERTTLQRKITTEIDHLFGFADTIEQGSKENGGKLSPLYSRADMWSKRGLDVFNTAKAMACGDQKLKWNLGATEKHCPSCLKLNGKVKRASYWLRVGVLPQNPLNPKLQCQGLHCDCGLDPTEEPLSRGPLPNLP